MSALAVAIVSSPWLSALFVVAMFGLATLAVILIFEGRD
jgi:hypothetical protein